MSDKKNYMSLWGWNSGLSMDGEEIHNRVVNDDSVIELKKINILKGNLFTTKSKGKPLFRLDDISKTIVYREGLRKKNIIKYPESHHIGEI